MAKYTSKQKSTIEFLINRGKAVHKKLEKSDNEFDKERNQAELDYIKSELSDALNAEARMNAHLRLAKEHLDKAEEIYTEWCRA